MNIYKTTSLSKLKYKIGTYIGVRFSDHAVEVFVKVPKLGFVPVRKDVEPPKGIIYYYLLNVQQPTKTFDRLTPVLHRVGDKLLPTFPRK